MRVSKKGPFLVRQSEQGQGALLEQRAEGAVRIERGLDREDGGHGVPGRLACGEPVAKRKGRGIERTEDDVGIDPADFEAPAA